MPWTLFSDQHRASVPPPPSGISGAPVSLADLAIRTMQTDIESMAKSGGGAPAAERVEAPQAISAEVTGEREFAHDPGAALKARLGKFALWGLIGVAFAAFLFLLGFYFLPLLFEAGRSEPSEEATTPSASLPPVPVSAPGDFTHQSLFRQRGEVVSVRLGDILSPADLRTYESRIFSAVSASDPASNFFEVELQDPNGRPYSWQELLGIVDPKGIAPRFPYGNFMRDYTAFVYRDDNGLWSGYAIRLQKGQVPLIVQKEVLKLEESSDFENFFLVSPGAPQGAFQDAQFLGQPIRVLPWSAPGARIAYGWFHVDYLVISTSLDGLKAAVERF